MKSFPLDRGGRLAGNITDGGKPPPPLASVPGPQDAVGADAGEAKT